MKRFLLLFLFLCGLVSAQSRAIRLELGFEGQIVANAYNPLRLSMRDQPNAELVLEIDQGSLRVGERPVRYRVPLAGGRGLFVFEDDLWVPAWRSFVWTVRTPEAVLASGSFDPRTVNAQPLHLVLGARIGAQRERFGREARVVDVAFADLPERIAAYDGVATLLVLPEALPPRLQSLVSAAAAGANVVLLEPVDSTLARLAREPETRLGAGWLTRTPEAGLTTALARERLEPHVLAEALVTPDLLRAPQTLPHQTIFIAASLYTALVFALLRFGRVPGLMSAFLLAPVLAFAAWSTLRPDEAVIRRSRSLHLSSGGLTQTLDLEALFSLPEQTLSLNAGARPLEAMPYTLSPAALELSFNRWSGLTLFYKPVLRDATLTWTDNGLRNSGDELLTETFVLGYGKQADLPPRSELTLTLQPDSLPSALYEPLLPFLPPGTALARRGGQIHVLLPPSATPTAGLR